jgi:hypothetical protein
MTRASVWDWNTNPNNNATIDGAAVSEGCAPSGINNAIRSLMAATASALTSTLVTGTADALVLTLPVLPDALVDGMEVNFRAASANATTTPTLKVTLSGSAGTAETITKFGGAAVAAGDIAGNLFEGKARYNLANTRWELLNPATISTSAVGALGSFTLFNGDLTASVGSNALTIAIKTTAGADPSDGDPVYVVFRNATLTSGTHTALKINAATSLVISSGSLLGTSNSVAFRLWIVGFNDGGTFRLGAVNCVSGGNVLPLRDDTTRSSTAEGGLGAADSAQVIYTGTAVTSKAMRILAYMDWNSGLGTAGSWSATPDKIQHFHSGVALPGTIQQIVNTETGAVATGTTTVPLDDTIPQITEGDQYMSLAITPTNSTSALQIDVVWIGSQSTSNHCVVALFQDSTANALAATPIAPVSSAEAMVVSFRHKMTAGTTSSTTLKVRAGDAQAGTVTFNGTSTARLLGGAIASSITITEISA